MPVSESNEPAEQVLTQVDALGGSITLSPMRYRRNADLARSLRDGAPVNYRRAFNVKSMPACLMKSQPTTALAREIVAAFGNLPDEEAPAIIGAI